LLSYCRPDAPFKEFFSLFTVFPEVFGIKKPAVCPAGDQKKIYPRLGSHSERELSRQCIFAPLTVFSGYIRADASKAREAPLLKMIFGKSGHFIEAVLSPVRV
jgi:hypothetical protein